MRYLLTVLIWCGVVGALEAQIQKTVHQSFDFPDSVRFISFQLAGDYVVETWPGNVVMSETRISLYNGSRGMLEYMLKNKRYELEGLVGTDSLTVRSIVMERPDIQTSEGRVTELLDVRLFVPQNFIKAGEGLWQREEEEAPEEPEEHVPQTGQGSAEGKAKHEEGN